ncbi:hypothetical protein AB4851_11990 [Burkholderia sp. 22PA0099]|uniref:hypothetical protein n=1 Tax=Burkholderia sp. 22PA0099 TaxID=3237372 RepID=UPI0039C15F88
MLKELPMELATRRKKTATRADLIALATGHYSGDPEKLLDRVAADLLCGASAELERKHMERDDILLQATMRSALAASLRKILGLERSHSRAASVAQQGLPVSRLSPEEVLEQSGMSRSTLYRGDGTRFYSVIPAGMQNGRAYPAWQFVGDIPSIMPGVLRILQRKSRTRIHGFFLTEQDSLNELSPAEVIAGLPFADRGPLAQAQTRMLGLSQGARLDKVIALAKLQAEDPD